MRVNYIPWQYFIMDLYFSSYWWIKHTKETREILPPCCASPTPQGCHSSSAWGVSSTQLHSQHALALPEQQALPGQVLLCSSGVTEGKGEVMVVWANPKALLRTGLALFLCHCWDFSSETRLIGTGHREVCSSVRVEVLGVCPCLGVGRLCW